jgi:transposase
MDLHANAPLSWSGRRELARRIVDQGWALRAAAEAAGVSVRCARRWVGRFGDRGTFACLQIPEVGRVRSGVLWEP